MWIRRQFKCINLRKTRIQRYADDQIRFGLIDLDEKKVLVYAKPEIELAEMAQMRLPLLRKKKKY